MRQEWRRVIPACTFSEVRSVLASPLCCCIADRLPVRHLSFTATNLAVPFNGDMSIVRHTTVLTAAIDRGHDEGCTTDSYIGFLNKRMEVRIRSSSRVLHITTSGTEYEAYIDRTINA